MTTKVQSNVGVNVESGQLKLTQIIGALLLGAVLLYGVGFAPLQAAHNAAHDTRHSYALPCH